jgi:hypothetical protein
MDECIRSVEVGERSRPDQVDDSRFQIYLNGSGYIFRIGRFGKVDVDCMIVSSNRCDYPPSWTATGLTLVDLLLIISDVFTSS